jgi:hypothetical protein
VHLRLSWKVLDFNSVSLGKLKSLYEYLLGIHIIKLIRKSVPCSRSASTLVGFEFGWYAELLTPRVRLWKAASTSVGRWRFHQWFAQWDLTKKPKESLCLRARVHLWTSRLAIYTPRLHLRASVVWGCRHVRVQFMPLRYVSVSGRDDSLTKQLPGWSCQ